MNQDFLLTPWWDLLTFGRGLTLILMIGAWGFAGWLVSPMLFEWFNRWTAGYVQWMVATYDRMFLTITPRECTLRILASMLGFGLVGLLITAAVPDGAGYAVLRLVICLVLAIGPFGLPTGYNFPRFLANWQWNRRIDLFETQMLDGLAFMSNGLKSGLSLVQSMDMVRQELPNPIAEEFGLVMSQQRVGMHLDEALIAMEDRLGTEDLRIMVTSILILRQSGGNLSETFDTISYTIRERKKVEGRIKTLTAQGVSQGVIIVCMPFVLAFVLWVIDPVLMSRMWTTALGWGFILGMLVLQAAGAWLIRKIVLITV